MTTESGSPAASARGWIAAPWHTVTILLFFALMIFKDAHHASDVVASASGPIPHGAMIRGYLISILFGAGMAYWCWAGVHWNGGTLRDLTGGRWTKWSDFGVDIAIAVPFLFVWEGTASLMHRLVDSVQTATTPYQAPSGFVEVSLWILVSLAAGIGEEIIFRGYLQKQFQAASRSIVVAVILQGLVFGLLHTYEGWKQVMIIAPLGILYGALAAWRKNLRANMIAHTVSDLWEGWLKFM
jgi:membrane protease YdiL (CAAX protease family)